VTAAGLIVAVIFLSPAVALAQFDLSLRPATKHRWATSTATTRPASELQKLVGELGALDSDVRDRARRELMGVGRPDLETLRSIVSAGPKLTTSQTSLLRDVAIHVFLATESYEGTGQGLLGVKDLAAVKVSGEKDEEADENLDGHKPQGRAEGIIIENHGAAGGILILPDGVRRIAGEIGVVVSERMPGFCAYRHLDTGDVVLAVKGERTFRPRTVWDFQAVVKSHEPGDTITLQVLRRGKVVDVTLTLDAYPACAMNPQTSQLELERFRRERDEAAEQYWQKNFGELVGDGVS
jgi:hypothetical protein